MSETIRFLFGCATVLLICAILGGLVYGCQQSGTLLAKACIEQGGIWETTGLPGRCLWSRLTPDPTP